MTEKEKDDLCKEAREHVHFVRNSNIHAYTSIIINKLLQIIDEQDAAIDHVFPSSFENGTQ